MVIFSGQAGKVTRVSGNVTPLSINITSTPAAGPVWLGLDGFKAAITGLGIKARTSYQVMHSLDDVVRFYVFGERTGDLSISGLTFLSTCFNGDNVSGFEYVLQFYNNYRLSKTGIPLTISIGASFSTFALLTEVDSHISDPATGLGQFNFICKIPPLDLGSTILTTVSTLSTGDNTLIRLT